MFNEQIFKVIILSLTTGSVVLLALMGASMHTSRMTVVGRYIRRAIDVCAYILAAGALLSAGNFLLALWVEVLK